MLTLIGQVVTNQGLVHTVDAHGGNDERWSMPATAYRRRQPASLPVHFDHDRSWPVGQTTYLERSKADGLLAVAVLERDDLADLLSDGDWFISDSVRSRSVGLVERSGGILEELSLVRRTGNVNTLPLRWSRSDGAPLGLPLNWHGPWRQAHERMSGARYRRAPDHLDIVDRDPLGLMDELLSGDVTYARQMLAQRPTPPARASTRPPAPKPITPRPTPKQTPVAPPSFTLWDELAASGAA